MNILFLIFLFTGLCFSAGDVRIQTGGSGSISVQGGGSGYIVALTSSTDAPGGGGGGGNLLIGEDTDYDASSDAFSADDSLFVWDAAHTGSDAPYTAVASGVVAKAVIKLAADGAPATGVKVCAYDDNNSDALVGCCTGGTPSGSAEDLELTSCDEMTVTSGVSDWWLTAVFQANSQVVACSGDSGKVNIDTDGTFASPPDPLAVNTSSDCGFITIYMTD